MFYKFARTIRFLSRVFGLVPKPLLRFLYRVAMPFGGPLAMLIRYLALKNLCQSLGDNVYLGADIEIRFFENLSVGSNVSIHRNCYLDALGGIRIGSEVSIAHQSSIVALEHGWDDTTIPIRDNPIIARSVEIADDVWIGAGCRILGGASIAKRSVVAAGSVYTAKTPAESGYLYAGVPAKRKKRIPTAGNQPGADDGPADIPPATDAAVREALPRRQGALR